MAYCTIQGATITAHDLQSLLHSWRQYGKDPVVTAFRFEGNLTDAQLSRLPKGLRGRLKTDDSVAWLEALYNLDSTDVMAAG